jgi:hypothetical protein
LEVARQRRKPQRIAYCLVTESLEANYADRRQ